MPDQVTPSCPGCKNGEEMTNFIRVQLDELSLELMQMMQRVHELKKDLTRLGFTGTYKEYDENVKKGKATAAVAEEMEQSLRKKW